MMSVTQARSVAASLTREATLIEGEEAAIVLAQQESCIKAQLNFVKSQLSDLRELFGFFKTEKVKLSELKKFELPSGHKVFGTETDILALTEQMVKLNVQGFASPLTAEQGQAYLEAEKQLVTLDYKGIQVKRDLLQKLVASLKGWPEWPKALS